MNRVISFRREELKRESHKLLDRLAKKYTEPKVRHSLSGYMGSRWRKADSNSGFHFGHDHSIKELERALLKEIEEANKKVPYSQIREAIRSLKKVKTPWYKKALRFIGL